jgi:adiponectin receptor
LISILSDIFLVHFCDTTLRNFYIFAAASLPLIAFGMSFSETFMKPSMGKYRASVFVAIGVSVAAPLFHFSIVHQTWHEFASYLLYGGACYIVGAFLYAVRIPERLFPGHFDIWVIFYTVSSIQTNLSCYSSIVIRYFIFVS